MTANKSWFAVRVKTSREKMALQHLQRQGMDVYMPLSLQRIAHARKVSWQPRPFIPGYLFVHLSPEQRRWTTIRSTREVIGPVHFGGYYPVLDECVIEAFRARENDEGYIVLGSTPEAPFRRGEAVKIIKGPMLGLEGLFQCMRGEERALILLHLLQRKVPATVDIDQLVSA